MKLVSLFTLGLCAATATARSSQATLTEDKPDVPGKNPLKFCAQPDDYILEIKKADLSPNPPEAGTKLTITATGNFKKDVEEGAKVHLQVKYGFITLVKQTADLCETVQKVDLECPLKEGEMTLTKDVDLPAQIPPGKYTVLADVVTKDEDKITCLTAEVTFARNGAATFSF
ncbi:Phosphatidylglycerol/phosphatidylinositol transfer protein [Myriangium duriaei CBS 260.36]|uniref:Phosphatidylglycerol/phosphatidylinositol transfer protein n=1 Tax=Myriangium duriaei CBS 260.36 TaxID=1168546 RepID=A0A9P4J2I1_9PEZI|nr:Phosphatidylglycerol/phosphatidylinositol transfer protein [Myriangium duriaei CBS 260.36]